MKNMLRHANARRFVFVTFEWTLMNNSFLASYSIELKVLSRKDGAKLHVVITARAPESVKSAAEAEQSNAEQMSWNNDAEGENVPDSAMNFCCEIQLKTYGDRKSSSIICKKKSYLIFLCNAISSRIAGTGTDTSCSFQASRNAMLQERI
jgi:hypothetical protein